MGVLAAAFGAAFAWLRGRLRRYAAVERGVKALLYDRILQAFRYHAKLGYVTIDELKNFEYLYNAYHKLGGNGTGTELYARLKALPHTPPPKEEET